MCILIHIYHTAELSQNPSSDLHVSFLSSHLTFSKAERTYRMVCFYCRRISLTSGAKGPAFNLETIVSDPLDPVLKPFPQKTLSRDLSGDMFQEVWQPWSCWFCLLPCKVPPPHFFFPHCNPERRRLSPGDSNTSQTCPLRERQCENEKHGLNYYAY